MRLPRATSLIGFAMILLRGATVLADEPPAPEPEPTPVAVPAPEVPVAAAPSDRDMAIHERDKKHSVFVRGDLGAAGYTLGAGYMHLWEDAQSAGGLGGISWFGVGLDGRIFGARDPGRVAGAGSFATGRVSFAGESMGMSMELGAGAADILDRARGLASAGAAISFLYFDIGYTYQLPIDGLDRAGVIASHMGTMRITIPVYTYDRVVEKHPLLKREPR